MTVNLEDGTVYKVWWNHQWAPERTFCIVQQGQKEHTPQQWDAAKLIYGLAELNPRDHYNRNTGRKISFARAMNAAGITKANDIELRTRFWQEYFVQLGHW